MNLKWTFLYCNRFHLLINDLNGSDRLTYKESELRFSLIQVSWFILLTAISISFYRLSAHLITDYRHTLLPTIGNFITVYGHQLATQLITGCRHKQRHDRYTLVPSRIIFYLQYQQLVIIVICVTPYPQPLGFGENK